MSEITDKDVCTHLETYRTIFQFGQVKKLRNELKFHYKRTMFVKMLYVVSSTLIQLFHLCWSKRI
jgi:hypothetical protein